ncbi:MAG: HNH endonuclease [Jiangellaceae bacterium]
MSPKRASAAARRLAIEADPESPLRRARTARSDRRVGIRPAPDTMAVLSAFVPAVQGIAAWACLRTHAQHEKSSGDVRGLGQIMADTLIERVTGQSTAAAVPVEIGLTMTADTLLAGDDTPAALAGYGAIPAQLARELAAPADGRRAGTFLRRIFTDPLDDTVAHVDTRRRRFDGRLARLLVYRDQGCREPYCDAPIRHHDHMTAHRDGGPTSAANGQGLCERGNHVKEMPGWSTRLVTTRRHETETTTPTGHRYRSVAPPALGPGSNYRQRTHRTALRRLAGIKAQLASANRPPP